MKKIPMPVLTKIYKTIKDRRKEIHDKYKILKVIRFILNPKEDHYKTVKTGNAYNNNSYLCWIWKYWK